jgi:hypothetical protein
MPSQNYNQPITVEIAPVRPSAIVVSLSGGKDSTELLRRIVMEYLAALGWNDVPVMCHHQVVEEDWSGTLEYCQQICEHFRVPLYLSRAHYHGYACKNSTCDFQTLTVREREPEPARERKREGEVVNCKCDKCAQPTLEKIAEVTNLRELMRWRKAYPSSKVRFCTSYLKRDVFNLWVRQNRHLLGATPIVAMGERWAESPGRKKLPVVRLRESVSTKDFQMYEWRPILHLSRQQVFRGILLGESEGTSEGASTGVNVPAPGGVIWTQAKASSGRGWEGGVLDVHPCYYAQGLTREQMLDENVEGGPRMSCVFCFYNTDRQLQINGKLPENRELLESFIRTEEEIGYTIRQGVSLRQIVGVGVSQRPSPKGRRLVPHLLVNE